MEFCFIENDFAKWILFPRLEFLWFIDSHRGFWAFDIRKYQSLQSAWKSLFECWSCDSLTPAKLEIASPTKCKIILMLAFVAGDKMYSSCLMECFTLSSMKVLNVNRPARTANHSAECLISRASSKQSQFQCEWKPQINFPFAKQSSSLNYIYHHHQAPNPGESERSNTGECKEVNKQKYESVCVASGETIKVKKSRCWECSKSSLPLCEWI